MAKVTEKEFLEYFNNITDSKGRFREALGEIELPLKLDVGITPIYWFEEKKWRLRVFDNTGRRIYEANWLDKVQLNALKTSFEFLNIQYCLKEGCNDRV